MAQNQTSILNALLFKQKPDLPALKLPTLAESQLASTEGNFATLPRQKELAAQVDAFNQERLMQAFRSQVTGATDILEKVPANIIAGLEGRGLSEENVNRLFDLSAAKGLGLGYGVSSGFRAADFERNVFGAGYDITQRSINSAMQWLEFGRRNLIAPQYDITSAFADYKTQYAADTERAIRLWNYDWFKSQHEAQPEPWEAAVGGLMDWVANTSLSVASMGISNIMGGGSFTQPGGGGGGGGSRNPGTNVPAGTPGTGWSWGPEHIG